jgi:hypothetical protein
MEYDNMHSPIGNSKKMNDILKIISMQEEQCPTFHNTNATMTMRCSQGNGNNSPRKVINSPKGSTRVP